MKLSIISIIMLLIVSALASIASGNSSYDTPTEDISGDNNSVLSWEFLDDTNYILDNTKLENGKVTLVSETYEFEHTTKSDFMEGTPENILITDDGKLELSKMENGLVLDINTDMGKNYSIDADHWGYQTFKFQESIVITKIMFLLQKGGRNITSELNVTLVDNEGKTLQEYKILPSQVDGGHRVIEVELNYQLEADTTYRLYFNSSESIGKYELIAGTEPSYEDGSYNDLKFNKNPRKPLINTSGMDNDDIELEIYGEVNQLGTYVSEIIDAGAEVIWSKFHANGELTSGKGDIKIQFRHGDSLVAEDGSWSQWSEPVKMDFYAYLDIPVPASSFIQYKITISTSDLFYSPQVDSISLSYDKFVSYGSIETLDVLVDDTSKWFNFIYSSNLNGQNIEFYYSVDSGMQWHPIYGTDELPHNSTKIRIKAQLISSSAYTSPELVSISITYSDFETALNNDIEIDDSSVQLESEPTIGPLSDPVVISTIGIFSGALALTAIGVGTETGKYSMLKYLLAFIFPLYSKIEREKVLDHYVRNQIYKYIETNPGTCYSDIMKDVGVKNGVLVHHLKTLEREELIKSHRDGMYRRFYPMYTKIASKEIDELSWFQLRIYNIIRTSPGIKPNQIAEELGKSKQVINYHLNQLKSADLIRTDTSGKHSMLYIALEIDENNKI
ncbi:MAG: winged helix-turn-helix transcriptional regulator [Thermoplasmata archaeon]|nr:MAG: winged helix-turn-helix transcriptional regulator [Thermoplasmata archaeon]